MIELVVSALLQIAIISGTDSNTSTETSATTQATVTATAPGGTGSWDDEN